MTKKTLISSKDLKKYRNKLKKSRKKLKKYLTKKKRSIKPCLIQFVGGKKMNEKTIEQLEKYLQDHPVCYGVSLKGKFYSKPFIPKTTCGVDFLVPFVDVVLQNLVNDYVTCKDTSKIAGIVERIFKQVDALNGISLWWR